MISHTTEYAFRAIVHLAQNGQESLTTQALAKATKAPAPYLHKILRTLAKAKLLTINRGRHGGFALARPPAQIDLAEIITAIHPIDRIQRCPLGLRQHGRELCRLHTHLDRAIQAYLDQFQGISLAELMGTSPDQPALCPPESAELKAFAV